MDGHRYRCALGILGLLALLGIAQARADLFRLAGIVSEQARSFGFQQVTLRPGGSVVLRNDDATAVHHPYIENAGATRDFGDQEPGSQATLSFPDPGTFEIICGVHPKMKLTVIVR